MQSCGIPTCSPYGIHLLNNIRCISIRGISLLVSGGLFLSVATKKFNGPWIISASTDGKHAVGTFTTRRFYTFAPICIFFAKLVCLYDSAA